MERSFHTRSTLMEHPWNIPFHVFVTLLSHPWNPGTAFCHAHIGRGQSGFRRRLRDGPEPGASSCSAAQRSADGKRYPADTEAACSHRKPRCRSRVRGTRCWPCGCSAGHCSSPRVCPIAGCLHVRRERAAHRRCRQHISARRRAERGSLQLRHSGQPRLDHNAQFHRVLGHLDHRENLRDLDHRDLPMCHRLLPSGPRAPESGAMVGQVAPGGKLVRISAPRWGKAREKIRPGWGNARENRHKSSRKRTAKEVAP